MKEQSNLVFDKVTGELIGLISFHLNLLYSVSYRVFVEHIQQHTFVCQWRQVSLLVVECFCCLQCTNILSATFIASKVAAFCVSPLKYLVAFNATFP